MGFLVKPIFDLVGGLFSPPKLPKIVAPPPPVARDDPAVAVTVADARKKQRIADLRRRGRPGTRLFGKTPEAQLGATPLSQPQARRAQLLGG